MSRRVKRVVVAVVAVGEQELYSLTIPTIREWCRLHGHILETIQDAAPYSSPFWAKFKAFDLFAKHDADCVIMMDADILIKPGSPTPLRLRPHSGVHAFDSMSLPVMRDFVRKQQARYAELVRVKTGQVLPMPDHYLNGGVCVVWKDAADFLAPPPFESLVSTGFDGAFDDQNLMNARAAARFHPLPRSFNWGHPHFVENLQRMKDPDVYFVHLNCPGDKVKVAKEILAWPCFRLGRAKWWLRYRFVATPLHRLRIVMFRLRKAFQRFWLGGPFFKALKAFSS